MISTFVLARRRAGRIAGAALGLLVLTALDSAEAQPHDVTVELAPRQPPLIGDGATPQRLRLRFSTKDVSRQIRVTLEGAQVLGITWPYPRVVEVVLVPEPVNEPRTATAEVLAYVGNARVSKRVQVVLLPAAAVPPPPTPSARSKRQDRRPPVAHHTTESEDADSDTPPPSDDVEVADAPPDDTTPSDDTSVAASNDAVPGPEPDDDPPPPTDLELTAQLDAKRDTDSPTWSIGIKAGVLTNFGAVVAPVLQVDASARIPRLGGLRVGVDAGATFVQLRQGVTPAGAPIDVTLWTLPLMARLAYRFELGEHLRLTLSAGGGVVLVGTTLSSAGQLPSDRLDAVPGFGGMVALAYLLGPGALTLDVGYHRAVMSGDITGNVAGLTVAGGYAFDL